MLDLLVLLKPNTGISLFSGNVPNGYLQWIFTQQEVNGAGGKNQNSHSSFGRREKAVERQGPPIGGEDPRHSLCTLVQAQKLHG